LLLALIPLANAPGSITLVKGTIIASKYGTLAVTQTMTMASMIAYANGTIMFNVTGYELSQQRYQFTLHSYGNGTWPIRFAGKIPITITDLNALTQNYSYPFQNIYYSTAQTTPLIVVYVGSYPTESQSVLFRDDFLYTNPLLSSDWTIDGIYSPTTNPGIYTSSGYMVMTNQALPGTLTEIVDHVSSIPVFTPSSAVTTGTAIKRKLTVSLIPFAVKQTSSIDSLNIGFTHLVTAAQSYPPAGNLPPYGTPDTNQILSTCSDSAVGADNIGIEAVNIASNGGGTSTLVCSDPTGTITTHSLFSIDPTKYTVVTIETFGIFCSSCKDNVQPGSSWVWFRVYQEDSSGKIIVGSDNNFNQTTNVAPYYGTAPVYFFAAMNTGGVLTETSKIDMVQWQSYGSPVCLVANAGFLCTRLPPVPPGIIGNNGLVGLMAWLANQIGFGDEQTGAIILFMILSFAIGFAPFFFTRNVSVGVFGEMLIVGFFTYVGFFPVWTLIIVFMGGAAVVVMIAMRMLGGGSGSMGE